jgi:hypothetical protein
MASFNKTGIKTKNVLLGSTIISAILTGIFWFYLPSGHPLFYLMAFGFFFCVGMVLMALFSPKGRSMFRNSMQEPRLPHPYGNVGGSGKNWLQRINEQEDARRRNDDLQNARRRGIREGLGGHSDHSGPSRDNPYGYSGAYGGPKKQRKNLFR